MQRREVSLASAYCRGFFVFGEEKEKSFSAEFAEGTPFAKGAQGKQRTQSFGRGEEK